MGMTPNTDNPRYQEFVDQRNKSAAVSINRLARKMDAQPLGKHLTEDDLLEITRTVVKVLPILMARLDDAGAIIRANGQQIFELERSLIEAQTAINMLVFDQPIQGGGPLMRSEQEPAYETAAQ